MKTTVSACVAGRLCNKMNYHTTSELVIFYQQLSMIAIDKYKTILVYLIVRNAKSKIQERFCDFHAKEKESQTAYMRNKQLITFFGLVASICPNCHLLFLQQLGTDDHTYVCDAFARCSKYSHCWLCWKYQKKKFLPWPRRCCSEPVGHLL